MPNKVTYSIIAKDMYSRVAKRINASTTKIRKGFRGMKVDANKAGAAMKRGANSMRGSSLAMGAGIVAAMKSFGDLEEGVTQVMTLLDDDKAIVEFGPKLKKAAEEAIGLGFPIKDTTKALFDNVSALGATERSMEVWAKSQVLARGGVTDLKVAVDGMTSIMNAYKLGTKDADFVANAFFTSQKKGKVTVAELAANVGKVAPIAQEAGVGLDELLATMAQLTLGGIPIEESTTAIKGAISTLIKPAKEAGSILRRLGIATGATAVSQRGLGQTLADLAEATKKYPDALAKAVPNIRAYTGVAALKAKELENIQRIMARIQNDMKTGEGLDKAAAMQMNTFNQAMRETRGSITLAAASLGRAMAPAMIKLSESVRRVTDWFQTLSPGMRQFIGSAMLAVIVITPLLVVLGVLIPVLGIAASGAAMIAGAIFTIPAAAAAAIVAFKLLVENWDKVKEYGGSILGKAKSYMFGDESLDVTGTSDINTSSQHNVQIGLNAPKGLVNSIQTKTAGKPSGLIMGVGMTEYA